MRHFSAFATLAVLAPFSLLASARADLESGRKDLDLGLGLLGTDARVASCLIESKDDGLKLEQNAIGGEAQNVIAQVTFVADSSELAEKLNVSGSANISGRYGFGAVKVDAKAEFAKNHKESRNSMYLLVKTHIQNGSIVRVSQPRIKDEVMTDKPEYEEFRQRCGDRFVSGVIVGGEFIGVIEFSSDNEDTRESLKASLSAAVSTVTTKGKVKLTAESVSAFKRSGVSINYWYYRAAGRGAKSDGKSSDSKKLPTVKLWSEPEAANPIDAALANAEAARELGADISSTDSAQAVRIMMQRMIEAAEKLPETVQSVENAVPLAYIVSDYFSGVENFPYVVPTPLAGRYQSSRQDLDGLLAASGQLQNKLDDVNSMISDRKVFAYGPMELARAKEVRDQLATEVDDIHDRIAECMRDYSKCSLEKGLRSETLANRLASIDMPGSMASRAIQFISKIVNNRTFTLNASQVGWENGHDSWISFQFVTNRGRRPYLKEEDARLWGEETTTADRYYFLEHADAGFSRDNFVSYLREDEQPALIYDEDGNVTSATYYFGYWNSGLGILNLTVYVNGTTGKEDTYTLNLNRSTRYHYKSGVVTTPTWQALGRLYLVPRAR